MQLDGSTQLTRTFTQRVTLRFSPCSPFDNDYKAEFKEFLPQLPLQRLNPRSTFFIVKIDGERIHPLIGSKANSVQTFLKALC